MILWIFQNHLAYVRRGVRLLFEFEYWLIFGIIQLKIFSISTLMRKTLFQEILVVGNFDLYFITQQFWIMIQNTVNHFQLPLRFSKSFQMPIKL